MTRAEVLSQFTVANGTITNPGKFEGTPLYIPYFWDAFLNGMADDDGETLSFDVEAFDLQEFPELASVERVCLWESDQGFVNYSLEF